ncbi:MAG: acyltransferase family protein [Pseudorhodoplanes sp.]
MEKRGAKRVDWVDYGKGFCIVMVVMMHSTLGVEAAAGHEGWLHHLVAFAKPFRIPDFFLISGLFLARVIDNDWRNYLDRKVMHFAYFYVLWVTIQFLFKLPPIAAEQGIPASLLLYLEAFVEPFGTLWFIYLLPIFFVFVKATRRVSPVAIWICAAALEIADIHTGWMVIDEFASRFVYFYTGYVLARPIFALASGAQADRTVAVFALIGWATVNGLFVYAGYDDRPGISLALGLLGVGAVVAMSAVLAKNDALPPLRYCGRHSIVIYLAFFLPMVIARLVLLKTAVITDIGTVSLVVTAAGVVGALSIFWAVRGTRLRFLFARPKRFHLKPAEKTPVLQPAE